MKKNKRGIIISGSLVQDHEFIYPFYRLLEEGIDLDVCLFEGTAVKGYFGTAIPPNKNHPVKKIQNVNIKDYDILVIPGGVKCMEKIRQDKKIVNFIKEFNNTGKTIACICSGTQLLISAKVVKNRNISGYYSMIDDIENAGGKYVDKPAVIDKNIVTTAHYKDMGPWMKAALKLLNNS
ncbi:DJ-1/PfpI family protein [Candidatus Pelagibacter communis]|uniref:DJ-1/PfpI family protein n=1 Tax=Pelagibacter ubique TaxID=198252 RepID=UPI00065B43BF|nr:DJ-1/PfpI family protein [Candidatus Pelagibacter ubique]